MEITKAQWPDPKAEFKPIAEAVAESGACSIKVEGDIEKHKTRIRNGLAKLGRFEVMAKDGLIFVRASTKPKRTRTVKLPATEPKPIKATTKGAK